MGLCLLLPLEKKITIKKILGGGSLQRLFSLSDSFPPPWTVAHQAPLSRGFPGKNTGVDCHFQSISNPGDLRDSRIEPTSLASPALTGRFFTTAPPEHPKVTIRHEN